MKLKKKKRHSTAQDPSESDLRQPGDYDYYLEDNVDSELEEKEDEDEDERSAQLGSFRTSQPTKLTQKNPSLSSIHSHFQKSSVSRQFGLSDAEIERRKAKKRKRENETNTDNQNYSLGLFLSQAAVEFKRCEAAKNRMTEIQTLELQSQELRNIIEAQNQKLARLRKSFFDKHDLLSFINNTGLSKESLLNWGSTTTTPIDQNNTSNPTNNPIFSGVSNTSDINSANSTNCTNSPPHEEIGNPDLEQNTLLSNFFNEKSANVSINNSKPDQTFNSVN